MVDLFDVFGSATSIRCMFLRRAAHIMIIMPWCAHIRTPNFFRLQPDFGPVNVSVLVKVRQTDTLKLVLSSSKTSKLLEFTAASRLSLKYKFSQVVDQKKISFALMAMKREKSGRVRVRTIPLTLQIRVGLRKIGTNWHCVKLVVFNSW